VVAGVGAADRVRRPFRAAIDAVLASVMDEFRANHGVVGCRLWSFFMGDQACDLARNANTRKQLPSSDLQVPRRPRANAGASSRARLACVLARVPFGIVERSGVDLGGLVTDHGQS
jgi:predicted anti-sigma-YlaC factor YlaD